MIWVSKRQTSIWHIVSVRVHTIKRISQDFKLGDNPAYCSYEYLRVGEPQAAQREPVVGALAQLLESRGARAQRGERVLCGPHERHEAHEEERLESLAVAQRVRHRTQRQLRRAADVQLPQRASERLAELHIAEEWWTEKESRGE